ncbi:MAG: hypothetical protein ACOC2N_02890 [Spirochaetota bacterium]
MSGKRWKATRQRLKPTEEQLDAQVRGSTVPPRWRRFVGRLFPSVVSRWWERWERDHEETLRAAMKKTAHQLHPRGKR